MVDIGKDIRRSEIATIKSGKIAGPLEAGDAWGKALENNRWVEADGVEGVTS